MKLEIQRFGAENFCIFKEPIEVTVDKKLIWVTGPNGSGKTSLLDIIPFAFYGVTSKGMRGESVINNTTKKNCRVWVEFKLIEEGENSSDVEVFKIERMLKYKNSNRCVIIGNGNSIIREGVKECTEFIEKLLPSKIFFNTVFFGQGVRTFFTDLTEGDQKEIFRKLLDLDKFAKLYKITSEELGIVDNKLSEISRNVQIETRIIKELEENKRDLEIKKSLFENNKKSKINLLEKELEEKKTEQENMIKILQRYNFDESRIESLQKEKEEELTKRHGILMERMRFKSSVQKLEREIEKIDLEKMEIEKKISAKISEMKLEGANQLNSIKNEIFKIETEITNLKKLQSDKENSEVILGGEDADICPTCLQPLLKFKENFLKKREILLQEIEKIKEEINKKIVKKSVLEGEFHSKKREILEKLSKLEEEKNSSLSIKDKGREELVKEFEVENRKIEHYENELKMKLTLSEEKEREINETLAKLTNGIKKLQEIEITIERIEREIQSLQSRVFEAPIETIEEKIKSSQIKLIEYENSIKEIEKKKNILDFWRVGFSPRGITSILLDNIIPFLNERVNYYLEKFGRIQISFDTVKEVSGEEKDKFNIHVLDLETGATDKKTLSGGQIRQIDISVLLALYDLKEKTLKTNLRVFDELFDSLDPENIRITCNLLQELKENHCVLLISHRNINELDADEIFRL